VNEDTPGWLITNGRNLKSVTRCNTIWFTDLPPVAAAFRLMLVTKEARGDRLFPIVVTVLFRSHFRPGADPNQTSAGLIAGWKRCSILIPPLLLEVR
jgi:hypothetical protein